MIPLMTAELTRQDRQRARRAALQGLYQLDVQRIPAESSVSELLVLPLAEAGLEGPAADHARKLAAGTWAASARYDEMLTEAAKHWDVARMPAVDRNILRLALHELIEHPNVPARVIIDEAIEIGREFGSAETPQFVNGVLDAIWKSHPVMKVARAGEAQKT